MSNTNLCNLPTEVLQMVMEYLPNRDPVNLSQACFDLRRVTEIQSFWRKKAIREYSELKNVYKYNRNWFEIYIDRSKFTYFCLGELEKMTHLLQRRMILTDDIFQRFATKSEEMNGVGYFYMKSLLLKVFNLERIYIRGKVLRVINPAIFDRSCSIKVYEFLTHYHLKKKWNEYCNNRIYLTPEKVAAFYMEFIGPALGDHEMFDQSQFQLILKNVERLLPSYHPFYDVSKKTKESWKEKLHINNVFDSATCRKLITLIGEELLSNIHLDSLTPKNEKQTLINAFRDRYDMNCLYVFIYFEAALRRFGVRCDIASSDDGKFHLTWRENWTRNSHLFTIDFEDDFVNLNMVPADENKINPYSPDKILLHLADKTKYMIQPTFYKNAWELLYLLQPHDLVNIIGLSKMYQLFNKDRNAITKAFEVALNKSERDGQNDIFIKNCRLELQLHKTEIKGTHRT